MLAQPIFKWDWLYATAINEDHVDVSNGDLVHRKLCWLYISIALWLKLIVLSFFHLAGVHDLSLTPSSRLEFGKGKRSFHSFPCLYVRRGQTSNFTLIKCIFIQRVRSHPVDLLYLNEQGHSIFLIDKVKKYY